MIDRMIDRCYIEITNECNLNCHFCPKHSRSRRSMSMEEFDLVTDKLRGRVSFVYFHLMGEPLLHPLLPQFITVARRKGFKTVLTTNGTLLDRASALHEALPHKIQLSLHSHESNGKGNIADYVGKVMQFAMVAASRGCCVVLRLWNIGSKDQENETIIRLLKQYVPEPWKDRPDGFRMTDNLYLEYDRKFEWPETKKKTIASAMNGNTTDEHNQEGGERNEEGKGVFCKALYKQVGVLADGSVVPCCLDHDGDVTLGNIFRQSLEEILSSPRAKAMTDGFAHHYATEELCRNCESGLASNSFRGKSKKASTHFLPLM